MKILFACGGTAGHINPALAVASLLKEKEPDTEIVFAGNPDGMEGRLIPAAGFTFLPYRSKGIQRRLTFRNIRYNMESIRLLITAEHRAKKLLKTVRPDLVFGTGSYVSSPVLLKASKMGIKTMTHEANALPGVSNKIIAGHVDSFLVAVEEAIPRLPHRDDYVVTGNPIRPEILRAERKAAREKLGISEDTVCIVSFGGSLGANRLNMAIADLMAWHAAQCNFYHIHATGTFWKTEFHDCLSEKNLINHPHLDVREFIHDMPDCLAAADLVISRCGAITLAEIEAVGRASVLIPSPNVAENHQYHNAMVLANHKAAVVIEEKDLTGDSLIEKVRELTNDPATLVEYGQNAKKLGVPDSTEMIIEEIHRLMKY